MSDKKRIDGVIIGVLLALVLMILVVAGGMAFWFITVRPVRQAEEEHRRAMEALQDSLNAQAIAEQMRAAAGDSESTDALLNEDASGSGEQETTASE